MATRADLDREDEGPRALGVILAEFEQGSFHADASRDLMKLNLALHDHAKLRGAASGEMVLTLKLKCDDQDVVTIAATYKVKAPLAPRRSSVFFLSKGGNLSTRNPKQQELPLRDVSAPAQVDVLDKPSTRKDH
jgi:hypothetical protein